MGLETVTQNEWSQKEKNKYHMLICIYLCGIQKNGIYDLICKTEIDTQM